MIVNNKVIKNIGLEDIENMIEDELDVVIIQAILLT